MGRHRTNPLYNGHIGNGNGSHQPQFEAGNKPFIKPNQVHATLSMLGFCYTVNLHIANAHVLKSHRGRVHRSSTTNRTTQGRCSLRKCLHDSARKENSMLMRYKIFSSSGDSFSILSCGFFTFVFRCAATFERVIVITLVFLLPDQSEASTVLHLEQKTTAKDAATHDHDPPKYPRFTARTGTIFTLSTYQAHEGSGKHGLMCLSLCSLHSLAWRPIHFRFKKNL